MLRYAWYGAKLISHEVFCSVNQVTFPDEVKAAKCEFSKHLLVIDGGVKFCVFIAFMMSSIWNPESLSP
jgi:hypothetical protein